MASSSGVQSWIRGSLIGAGAFGKVNLAVNRDNGQLFAVKSIECSSTAAAELRALENEVQILESLASPYVVSCLGSDWSVEKGRRMRNVFLEYMPGGSLADLMQKLSGKLEEPLIRAYTRSILEGLNYLHSRGVVHCDIKGKNVLVGTSGLKLADFGSAKRLAAPAAAAADGTTTSRTMESIKGTPLWMAPEVARQVEQGTASDIWSLGCTVVEMATGKAPWSHLANPLVALYHIGCTDDVPPMPASLSPEGLDFLAKCFQRDAAVRPTAEQLLAHPFITGHYCQPAAAPPAPVPASPCSVLDSALLATWDTSSSSETSTNTASGNSTVMNSVPILALKQRTAAAASAWVLEPKEHEQEPQQQAGCATTEEDWWCTSPLSPKEGQWITVRSPKPAAAVAAAAAVPWPAPAVLGERVKLGLNFAQLLQAAASSSSEEKVEEKVVVLDKVEKEEHKDEAEEIAATAAVNAKAPLAAVPAAAEEQELAPAAASAAAAADSCAHDATATTTSASASASAAAEEKCAAAAAAYAEDSLVDDYPSSSSASSCPAPSECTRAHGDEDHGCSSSSSGEPSRHTSSRGSDCAAASASGSQMEEEEEEEGGPGAAHPRRRWIRNFSRNCGVSLGPRRTRRRTNSQNCFFHKRLLLWPSRMLLFMRISSSHAGGGGSRQPLLAPCILFFMFSKHGPSWLLFRNRVLASHLLDMPLLLLLVVCAGWMDGFHMPSLCACTWLSLACFALLVLLCLPAAYRARRETAHHSLLDTH